MSKFGDNCDKVLAEKIVTWGPPGLGTSEQITEFCKDHSLEELRFMTAQEIYDALTEFDGIGLA
jgi:hypothetical protein